MTFVHTLKILFVKRKALSLWAQVYNKVLVHYSLLKLDISVLFFGRSIYFN